MKTGQGQFLRKASDRNTGIFSVTSVVNFNTENTESDAHSHKFLTHQVPPLYCKPKRGYNGTNPNSVSRPNPVKTNYRLCCCAIAMIVLLRVSIGWHFFYEGIHKFDPATEFSSEGFLGIAKGPTAEWYYWMLPDLDGIQRLEMAVIEDENGRERDTFIVYENAWKKYFKEYLVKHSPLVSAADAENIVNMNAAKFAEWVEQNGHSAVEGADANKPKGVNVAKTKAIFDRYLGALRAEAADGKESVEAFKASRERFIETRKTVRNSASFEQERRWRQMMGYRTEASRWTKLLSEMGNGLQSDLGRLTDPALAGQKGQIVTAPEKELFPPNPFGVQYMIPPNPYVKSRMATMDLAVMLGLSAIGLCLIIGFCTRLACLGGAAFLINVVLTTYPVPGIYPEIPSMVGNFMFVSKDVVELAALLFLALIPSGRWGGLDYFLWHYGGKQIMGIFSSSSGEQ